MPYQSYGEYLEALDHASELRRIVQPVATELQVTALADAEMKSPHGGKALLVEQPTIAGKCSTFPLAINTMGSEKRMAMALSRDSIEDLAAQMRFFLKARPPASIRDAIALLRNGMDLLHTRPRKVRSGACKEVTHLAGKSGFSLDDLPILQCWPQDGGRFITLPTVYTRDPDTGGRNVGMYRMQIYDGMTTGMHWQVHKVAARHGRRYYERRERMPVAVALGGDPVCTFASTAPLPDGLDEILFAGFARKKSIDMIKCETSEIEVPADSDFVIEGYVEPSEERIEGPFGDHTGFYTPPEPYPVFHVTAITHRRDAVYPCTIVGLPPMEDFYMGAATGKIFLPIFQMTFPEIVDIALPAEGVFHNFVFVSIRKQYAWQAYKIMHALWGMGQMMFAKYIVVVDEDCDVYKTSDVLFRLGANTDPQRDSTFVKNPCDALDHATTLPCIGSHMGFDATRKLPSEGFTRPWPEMVSLPKELHEWAKTIIH